MSSTAVAIVPENSGRPPSYSRSSWLVRCSRLDCFCPIVVFLVVTDYERWRVGGFFWNKMGLEFTLLWTVAAFYFLVRGGGAISVDHLVIGREF
jgi:hypothetical protein